MLELAITQDRKYSALGFIESECKTATIQSLVKGALTIVEKGHFKLFHRRAKFWLFFAGMLIVSAFEASAGMPALVMKATVEHFDTDSAWIKVIVQNDSVVPLEFSMNELDASKMKLRYSRKLPEFDSVAGKDSFGKMRLGGPETNLGGKGKNPNHFDGRKVVLKKGEIIGKTVAVEISKIGIVPGEIIPSNCLKLDSLLTVLVSQKISVRDTSELKLTLVKVEAIVGICPDGKSK